jgi:serine/threonine protein kinase
VAEGLAHTHASGIIPRDIKPSNLILTPKGQVKILDFGVAKLRWEAGLTTTGTLLGTPRYMSLEQLSPSGNDTDHRVDIYSLGATLYELLMLESPYPGDDSGQVINAICNSEIQLGKPPGLVAGFARAPVPQYWP